MKKKLIQLLCGIILLLILCGTYYYGLNNKNKQDNSKEQVSENENYTLIDSTGLDIEYVNLKSPKNTIQLNYVSAENENKIWKVKGYEDFEFNQDNINSILMNFKNLISQQLISEDKNDLNSFGLNPPQVEATAKYNDGSEINIYIGNQTPDKNYYYIMTDTGENKDKVFIIDNLDGQRFWYNLNDLIDKNLPIISNQKILYLDVKQKEYEQTEIQYVEDENKSANDLAQYGMQTLRMKKPLEGAIVYPSNLQSTVLADTSALVIEDLVEIFPSDLKKYGLDVPYLIIQMKDSENDVKISIGNDIDDDNIYCMVNEKPHIFSMKKAAVKPFTDIDIFKFIERFVSLHYRNDINGVDIQTNQKTYKVTFEEETTDIKELNIEETTEDNSYKKDTRKSFVDGKEIEFEKFSDFYEMLTGITFDNIIETSIPQQTSEIIITYYLKNGNTDVIKYYNYNDDFYLTERNGEAKYIVNKQALKSLLEYINNL